MGWGWGYEKEENTLWDTYKEVHNELQITNRHC